MARPLLFMRIRASSPTTFGVFKYANGVTEQIGSSFGTGSTITEAEYTFDNHVVHWRNALYAVAPEDGIWKWTPTVDWTKVYSFASPGTGANGGSLGIFPVLNSSGDQVLVCSYVHTASTSTIRFVFLDKFDVGSETSNISAVQDHTNWGYKNPIKFQNKIYWYSTGSSNARISNFNPATSGFGQVLLDTGLFERFMGLSFCVLNKQLYFVGKNNAGTTYRLGRLEGSTAVNLGTFGSFSNSGTDFHKQLLFTDGTDLILFSHGGASTTVTVTRIQLDAGGDISTTTDITSDVLNFSTSVDATADKWWSHTDIETTPGTAAYSILYSPDSNSEGSLVSAYQWNDVSTKMTFLGAGADGFSFGVPADLFGGGHRAFSGSGEYNWTYEGSTINGSSVDVDFTLDGSNTPSAVAAASGDINVQLRFNKNSEAITSLATLTTANSGSLAGNIISGLFIDGSGAPITATWDAVGDGITPSDVVEIVGRVFRT